MYKFVVTYELPPMDGELTVEINAKDEHEALYLVRCFLTRGAIVHDAKRKHYTI
ncbi:hypothetical protein NK358_27420 [Bacillus sp. S0635]|uniref:hypothetical protein n=1 Tax=Bacillus sp. S0635 TaxID=2957807 RepID=UPI00209DE525|nr:hypothetical protein [Bacillus sp. S0635]MCP1285353.1 hypothetical protein [Bacillus sp. S0635]